MPINKDSVKSSFKRWITQEARNQGCKDDEVVISIYD